jgi:sugar lactone lactonase YvrE
VPATVTELRDGRPVPFPDQRWNTPDGDDDERAFVSVQSVVVDPADRLWVLDTGSPMFQPTQRGGPKLVCVDPDTDTVTRTIVFPGDVALPTTYLNDVRFDLRRGTEGMAFITDSSDQGPNGIIVVDLATGESWRRLHEHPSTKAEPLSAYRPVVEGQYLMQRPADGDPRPVTMGADGIAVSHDGQRRTPCRSPPTVTCTSPRTSCTGRPPTRTAKTCGTSRMPCSELPSTPGRSGCRGRDRQFHQT